MPPAATVEKTKSSSDASSDVLLTLEDRTVPVKTLLATVSQLALAKAWAGGLVEFGRRTHALTGGGKSSRLTVEHGIQWSGPKSVRHKPLNDLLAEAAPQAAEYKLYNKVAANDPAKTPLSDVTEAEAHEAVALLVRLTDKGLASLAN